MKKIIGIFLLLASMAYAQKPVFYDGTNLYSVGGGTSLTSIVAGGLVTASDVLAQYAKYHNTNTVIFTAADTWQDITFNFAPTSENSFGITLDTNDNKTISFDFTGHIEINGCLRPDWTGAPATIVAIASRVVYSSDSWATTNEARCLQAYDVREKQEEEIGMLPYHGSITVTTNMQIRLQGQVGDTNLILQGWSGFDNPTAATINLYCVGKKP